MNPNPNPLTPAGTDTSPILPSHRDKLAGFVEISANIVERQRAQAAILEMKRFLRGTIDALPHAIAILDEQTRILELNAAWKNPATPNPFLGYQCREGEDYSSSCESNSNEPGHPARLIAQGLRRVGNGEHPQFRLEYSVAHAGVSHWFIALATRCHASGPARIVLTHEDISQRKQVETQLAEARQLLLSRQQ